MLPRMWARCLAFRQTLSTRNKKVYLETQSRGLSMRVIVTGVAGFIGSSIADRMLAEGNEVIGIDCFVPYYPRVLKEKNLERALSYEKFHFLESDLCDVFACADEDNPKARHNLLDGIDVIYHQAAQAGVRASWGRDFNIYCHNNILGTQKLLEACKGREGLRVVYASSSSVYGETVKFPMQETDLPHPVSPYGVSKLSAEHLMCLYTHNFGVHTSSLRYFTVYGPRQRPDMAFHKLCRSVLCGDEFLLYGSGEQTRDFTFISDIVDANINAGLHGQPGRVYNIGGGTRISMNDVISMIENIAGRKANIKRLGRQDGDVTHTSADVSRAIEDWGYAPKVKLEDGLAQELEFIENVIIPTLASNK